MEIINSVLCDGVVNPPAGARLVYRFISGGEYPNYEKTEVSTFLVNADRSDLIRAVDSLRQQANDDHHIFIEGFEKRKDGSYRVILGS